MLIFPTANQNGIKQNCDKVNWNDPRTSCHVTITVSCNCRIFLTESSIIVNVFFVTISHWVLIKIQKKIDPIVWILNKITSHLNNCLWNESYWNRAKPLWYFSCFLTFFFTQNSTKKLIIKIKKMHYDTTKNAINIWHILII